jgi:rSAM/selenodomain-associated transferase 1
MKTALIIMAKAPEPGYAKTRLMPVLGAHGAAALAQRLLEHTVQSAMSTQSYDKRRLCVTPQTHHPAFMAIAAQTSIDISLQTGADLGSRMQHAFEDALGQFDAAVLIGTDAPAINATELDQAASDLVHHDAVFIPALDGGYALIGLKRAWPALFNDVPWGTDVVMPLTRHRLQTLGLRWREHPAVTDIDHPDDLVHLPPGFLEQCL